MERTGFRDMVGVPFEAPVEARGKQGKVAGTSRLPSKLGASGVKNHTTSYHGITILSIP